MKKRSGLLQHWRCSCKFKSLRIGSMPQILSIGRATAQRFIGWGVSCHVYICKFYNIGPASVASWLTLSQTFPRNFPINVLRWPDPLQVMIQFLDHFYVNRLSKMDDCKAIKMIAECMYLPMSDIDNDGKLHFDGWHWALAIHTFMIQPNITCVRSVSHNNFCTRVSSF
jgi:hypothetical protein